MELKEFDLLGRGDTVLVKGVLCSDGLDADGDIRVNFSDGEGVPISVWIKPASIHSVVERQLVVGSEIEFNEEEGLDGSWTVRAVSEAEVVILHASTFLVVPRSAIKKVVK
jgi:hypothetical protein